MRVLLIKGGVVKNVIHADSVERAQLFYPDHEVLEQVGSIGMGFRRVEGEWVAPPLPVPPQQDRRVTRLAFLTRFTDAEAVAIDLASQGATPQAAYMRRYMNKVNAATFIDLQRSDTRAGVLALESAGLLAAGRALAILDAQVQAEERYQGGV